MGYNITDGTCFYGLAQVDGECSRTLSSFDESAYFNAQIIYLAIGILTAIVTGIMYYRALKFDAPPLQQQSFLLGAISSITFFLRGIDPSGYRHIIPRPIVLCFSDACTSALYANYIFALGYWAAIIQQTAAPVTRPLDLKWIERISIASIIIFYLVLDMYTFSSKGFHRKGMTYLQMLGSAAFLAAISLVFAVYGVQVHNRLIHFEKQQKIYQERNRMNFEQLQTARSFDLGTVVDDIPVAEEGKRWRSSSKKKESSKNSPAAKIRRIIYVVEGFAVVVVAGQVYLGVKNSSGPDDELECANGMNCEDTSTSVSIMHWFQAACIWIIVWIFRKVEKKAVIPGEENV